MGATKFWGGLEPSTPQLLRPRCQARFYVGAGFAPKPRPCPLIIHETLFDERKASTFWRPQNAPFASAKGAFCGRQNIPKCVSSRGSPGNRLGSSQRFPDLLIGWEGILLSMPHPTGRSPLGAADLGAFPPNWGHCPQTFFFRTAPVVCMCQCKIREAPSSANRYIHVFGSGMTVQHAAPHSLKVCTKLGKLCLTGSV